MLGPHWVRVSPKTKIMAISFCCISKRLFGLELYKKKNLNTSEIVLLKDLNHLLGDILCEHSIVIWKDVMI